MFSLFIKCIFFYQKRDDDDGADMDSYQVLLLLLSNHMAWGTANANCHQLQKVSKSICQSSFPSIFWVKRFLLNRLF